MQRRLPGRPAMPRAFWFLWVGTIVNRLGGFVIPFLTLYLTSQRALPVSHAALMVSLFGAGSFTAGLVGGELSDRFGRRPVLLLSLFAAPLAMLALGTARAIPLIAGTMLFFGFFTDLYRPAVNAAVADLVPAEERPRAYGYLYWAINLGAAVAPILAGLMTRRDYFLLFLGNALTTFLFGILVLGGVPETRPGGPSRLEHAPSRERLASLRHEPLLLLFAGLALVFGTIYQQGSVTLPVDMRSHGLGPEVYGLVIALNGALIVLLGLPASNRAARWPRFGALALAGLLLGAGFGLPALAFGLGWYSLSVLVWTLGEIAAAAVAPAVVADLSPIDKRGLFQGVFGAAWGLSFFTGPVLGGWVLERYGAQALWAGCFVVGILLAVGYLAMAGKAQARMRALKDSAAGGF
jgi:MFS family permease